MQEELRLGKHDRMGAVHGQISQLSGIHKGLVVVSRGVWHLGGISACHGLLHILVQDTWSIVLIAHHHGVGLHIQACL